MGIRNRLFGQSSGLSGQEKVECRQTESYAEAVSRVVSKQTPTQGDLDHLKTLVKEISCAPRGKRWYGRAEGVSPNDPRATLLPAPLEYPHCTRAQQDEMRRLDAALEAHRRVIAYASQCGHSRQKTVRQVEAIIQKEVDICLKAREEIQRAYLPPSYEAVAAQDAARLQASRASVDGEQEPPSYEVAMAAVQPDARPDYLEGPAHQAQPSSWVKTAAARSLQDAEREDR